MKLIAKLLEPFAAIRYIKHEREKSRLMQQGRYPYHDETWIEFVERVRREDANTQAALNVVLLFTLGAVVLALVANAVVEY